MLFHSHCVFKDGLALSECLVSNSQFPVVQNLFNFVYLLPLTYSPSSSGTKKNRTSSKIEQNKKMPQQFIKNIKQQRYHSTIAVKAQSCKNVPTVPTSRCYFSPAGANFRTKHANNCAIAQCSYHLYHSTLS